MVVCPLGIEDVDGLIARVVHRVGDDFVATWRHYGQQWQIDGLCHVPRAGVVADEELAVGEEPHQFAYRSGLDLVKHAGLQRVRQ